ncbi:hypothetical protein MKW98_006146 [Papaver atlanticum]|uniref:Uncharacterized protein n=1 Tax=Papaver atlanticum TaxID=357466 RepID=A0AAD4TI68_9MAGN|nr:hypothetical protein MKW98_006146 [Papaver atlanticum]
MGVSNKAPEFLKLNPLGKALCLTGNAAMLVEVSGLVTQASGVKFSSCGSPCKLVIEIIFCASYWLYWFRAMNSFHL